MNACLSFTHELPQPFGERLDFGMREVRREAAVAYFDGSRLHVSTFGGFASAARRVSVGCIAKTITATLVAIAVSEGRLRLDDRLTDFLEGARSMRHSGELRLHHLLTHSHGLDDLPDSPQLRRRQDDFIDSAALLASIVAAKCIAAPGKVFHYGNTGHWLVAAVLEAVYGRTFADILWDKLLQPLGVDPADRPTAPVCPAQGELLRLSPVELVALARMHQPDEGMIATREAAFSALRGDHSFVHDGWHPISERVCAGWFDHGGGCFGHNGRSQQHSLVVRMWPATGVVIVAIAEGDATAASILSRVFTDILPGEGIARPAVLPVGDARGLAAGRYTGTFMNARHMLRVEPGADGRLRAQLLKRDAEGNPVQPAFIKRALLAASNQHFFAMPPEPTTINVLRFTEAGADGRFRYAHTQAQVLVRVD